MELKLKAISSLEKVFADEELTHLSHSKENFHFF